MLKNFLTLALRKIIRQKSYTFINVGGLAIGLASSILILLFVLDETNYDKHNKNIDQIYRLHLKGNINGNQINGAITSAPIGQAIVEEIPDVINSVRIYTFSGNPVFRYKDKSFVEYSFAYVDSSLFEIFTADFIYGNHENVLNTPNALVISESASKKYFGDRNPVGENLLIGQDENPYEVKAVIKDFPETSHFHFDIMASMISIPYHQNNFWISNNNYTYLLVRENADIKSIEERIKGIVKKNAGPQIQQALGIEWDEFLSSENEYGYYLQSLKDIHLKSDLDFELEPGGSIQTVYIFGIIAIFLILIASINFMNLSTAQATKRAREVGIRKVMGSHKPQLILQFLFESIILSYIALGIAMILVSLLIPSFNQLAGKNVVMESLTKGNIIGFLLLLGLFVGLISGSYPAFYISRFSPVKVLKGDITKGKKGSLTRQILVITQFIITISLIISTMTVKQQMNFFLSKDLGFDAKNVLAIDRLYTIRDQQASLKEELRKLGGVQAVSSSNSIFSGLIGNTAYRPDNKAGEGTQAINVLYTDEDFCKAYQIEILEGRYFSRSFGSDTAAIIMNEAALKAFQYDNPLEREVFRIGGEGNDQALKVIGILKDFHYQTLFQEIKPLVIQFSERGNFLNIAFNHEIKNSDIQAVKDIWLQFTDQPMTYSLMSDNLKNQYSDVERTGNVFAVFALLAILIASLGLFGLTSYTTEQRRREIGIRKCLGSSISNIIGILIKENMILLSLSAVIAWIASYFLMSAWLKEFAFRINLSVLLFLGAYLIALLLANITIIAQSYSAARRNPADVLRHE